MIVTRKEPGRGHITFTMINALVIIFAFSYKFPTTSGSYYFGQVFVYGFVTLMLLHLLLCRYSKLNSFMIIANLMMDAAIFALSFEHLDAGIKISQTWLFIFPFVLPIYSWIVHSLFNHKYYYDDGRRIHYQNDCGWNFDSGEYEIKRPGNLYY